MTQLLKILPLFAALVAAPALAAEPDPHTGHHPAAAAETPKPPSANADAKSAMHGCPMMDGKTAAAPGAMAGKDPGGKMMMDGKDMNCMPAPAAAKGADAPHDHDHPEAPK